MLCHVCWILWYSRTLKLFSYIEKSKNSTYFKAFHYFWSLIIGGWGKGTSEIQDIMCNRKTSLLLSSSIVLLKYKCNSLQCLQPKHCRTGPAWENHDVKLAVTHGEVGQSLIRVCIKKLTSNDEPAWTVSQPWRVSAALVREGFVCSGFK